MPLPDKKSQTISLPDASKLTANYRKSASKGPVSAGGFWKEAIQGITDQTACVAVRFYYAQKDDGSPALVLVGVDANGNDLTSGVMGDDFFPCPPFCSAPNPLNS